MLVIKYHVFLLSLGNLSIFPVIPKEHFSQLHAITFFFLGDHGN